MPSKRSASVKPKGARVDRQATKTARPKAVRNSPRAVKPKGAGNLGKVAKAVAPETAGNVRRVAKAVKPTAAPGMSDLARAAALNAAKAMMRKALRSGAAAVRSVADSAARTGRGVVETGLSKRLPIQVSIDVAVPLNVAWDEWMTFESFTEGVHRIEDVERDGDYLYGHTPAPLSAEWEAEIVDERMHGSFAWRSVKESDCAGLVTFHRLSERLTRIELNLDVLPTNASETFALALHVAHRRAEVELRRFKSRVEFISPDVYDEIEVSQNGGSPESDEEG
jgi:uncharacterized membrane protein